MKIAIFGTGKVFYYFWKYIDKKQIVCLVDNNEEKIGKYIDGIEIISPKQLKALDCDMVLTLSVYHDEMKRQLVELGIPESMIFDCQHIGNATSQEAWIYCAEKKCTLEDWCKIHGNNTVLLISHELSRTGAPIALMNMAKVMQKMGISVIYAGLEKGPLTKELEINGIDYLPNWKFLGMETQKQFIRKCNFVVICTFELKWLIEAYKDVETPVLWWIHEADAFYRGVESFVCCENVSVFCVGENARRAFQAHCEGMNAQILQYSIPYEEFPENTCEFYKRNKISFGLIGSICERKAQDILLKAVSRLPLVCQERIEIIIIGVVAEAEYWEEQRPLLEQLQNVTVTGEVSQKEVTEKYKEIDVLVSASREDPMPIVVTQAMMYEIPCILSKNVGQAEFIEQGINGFVFENEEELAEQMKWLIEHRERLRDIGKRARVIYEQNFREEIMEKRLEEYMWKNCK